VEEIVKIGDDTPTKSPRHPNASKPVNEAMRRLAGRLSDVFDTKVKVELGRNKGKITLEFANVGDLDRIVKAMSPEAAGAPEKQEAD
jgi:ParB family chromosome partitioning protein